MARRELLLMMAAAPLVAACARTRPERAGMPGPRDTAASGWVVRDAGAAAPAERRAWRDAVPAALDRVRGVWGASGPGEVVLVVPGSEREYVDLMGGPSQGGATAVFGGPRPQVVVSPGARLTVRQREALLAHELAHVAQRVTGTAGTGTWPLEGTAVLTQYAGQDPRRHPETVLLRTAAREGRLPSSPPHPGSFPGGEGSRLAYQVAWTMCLHLQGRVGRGGVVGMARDVTRGMPAAEALAARAGLTEAEMTRGWQEWVRTWV